MDGRPASPQEQTQATYATTNENVASINEKTGEIHALSQGIANITVTFTPDGGDGSKMTPVTSDPVAVTVAPKPQTTGRVTCSMEQVDEDTASALFGNEISKNYHVMQINIQDEDADHRDLIVYGASLLASVTIEQETETKPKKWVPVTEKDFNDIFASGGGGTTWIDLAGSPTRDSLYLRLNQEQRQSLAVRNLPQAVASSPVTWSSDADAVATVTPDTGLVTARSPGYAAITARADGTTLATWLVFVPDPQDRRPHIFAWNPLSSQIILDSAFIRFDRSRQRDFHNILQAAGSFGSFLTTGHILGGIQPIQILDAYNGLVLPGLDKFFPSHGDAEQTNLHRDLMQNVEQVGYGTVMTKYLLFPSGFFRGLYPNAKTRIGTIYPYNATLSVAYVTQAGTISVQPKTAAPPSP